MKQAPEAALEGRIREIASRVAEGSGLTLEFVEIGRMGGRRIVKMTIDREGGVNLDDCADFSRRVGAYLEAEDPIPGAYSLEVSSPGLDRRLVRLSDYERFRGQTAKVTLGAPVEGRRNFKGRLAGVEGSDIVMEVEGGRTVRLPFDSVEMARLVPEF
jgi:ribosome maturation factor RimP